MNRRPLIALAVFTASVLTLAAPAGAATTTNNKPDWVRIVLPCRVGHTSAVVGYSPTDPWWLEDPAGGDGTIRNPHGWRVWYDNPCKGQWLPFDTWGGARPPSA